MNERHCYRVDPAKAPPFNGLNLQQFRPEHTNMVATAMVQAYRGTVDYEGETPEQAADEITATINGAYGTFLPQHSWVCNYRGNCRGAILCAQHLTLHKPFIVFVFTHPAAKRKGVASRLIGACARSLAQNQNKELLLFVNPANKPAVRLYQKLGFIRHNFKEDK